MSKSILAKQPPCPFCGKAKLHTVCGKTSDLCFVRFPNGRESNGYVPQNLKISGDNTGDYIEFTWCEACGKIC